MSSEALSIIVLVVAMMSVPTIYALSKIKEGTLTDDGKNKVCFIWCFIVAACYNIYTRDDILLIIIYSVVLAIVGRIVFIFIEMKLNSLWEDKKYQQQQLKDKDAQIDNLKSKLEEKKDE